MYRFTVYGIPPTFNRIRRMVFQDQSREKREWVNRVKWLVRASKSRPHKPIPKCFVIYTFHFRDQVSRDATNLYGAVKMLEDGLVEANVLEDDSIRHTYPIVQVGSMGAEEEKVVIEVIPGDKMMIQLRLVE